MSTTTIYSHPDGHEIAVGQGRAVFKDDSELNHPGGLAKLGAALIERSIAEKHGQVSECAGAAMGAELVQKLHLLRGRPQAEAFRAVRDKLHALSKLEHADSAAGGFAGAIVNVLELGIAILPQCEEGADK